MNKQIINTIFISTILLSACSQKKESTNPPITITETTAVITPYIPNPAVEKWQDLIIEGKTNYEIAEIISGMVTESDRENIEKYLKEYSSEELSSLVDEIKYQEEKIRKELLYRGASYQYNENFLKSTIIKRPADLYASNFSIENTIKLSLAIREKNKFITEISTAYNSRIAQIAEEVAPVAAEELIRKNSEALTKIQKEIQQGRSKEEKIQEIARLVIKMDQLQRYLNTHTIDEVTEDIRSAATEAVSLYVAQKIYEEIQRSGTLEKLARLAHKVQKIQDKINEALVLASAIQHHLSNVHNHVETLTTSINDIRAASNAVTGLLKDEGFRKDILYPVLVDYAADRILNHSSFGKEIKKGVAKFETATSSIETIIKRSNNLSKSASGILNDFSVILKTTEALTRTLRIKLPNGVNKFIGDVQKVNEVVQGAQSVFMGFQTAGPVGAFMALSSGPAAKLLGGGASVPSFEETVMAQFKLINVKLDAILKNQEHMMRMQHETMKMVYDLAMMVDHQHHQVMSELTNIQYDINVLLMMGKHSLQQNIIACEGLIMKGAKINPFTDDIAIGMDPQVAETISQRLKAQLNGHSSIMSFIRGGHTDQFSDCAKALSQAFNPRIKDGSLRNAYHMNDKVNGLFVEEAFYVPLYRLLSPTQSSVDYERGVHMPFSNMENIELKLSQVQTQESSTHDTLDLQYLLSSEALIRYASNLLILHPYIEFDKTEWVNGYKGLMQKLSLVDPSSETRSQMLLKNALKLTQTAIAQEALLAGEPILNKAESHVIQSFSAPLDTYQGKDYPLLNVTQSAVRMNKVLFRNVMLYKVLSKNKYSPGKDLNSYEYAYNSNNFEALNAILFDGAARGKISKKGGKIVLNNEFRFHNLNSKESSRLTEVELPTPTEMSEGRILYSPNMPRLVLMQEKLMDALVKFSGDMKLDHKLMISNLLMGRNYEP